MSYGNLDHQPLKAYTYDGTSSEIEQHITVLTPKLTTLSNYVYIIKRTGSWKILKIALDFGFLKRESTNIGHTIYLQNAQDI